MKYKLNSLLLIVTLMMFASCGSQKNISKGTAIKELKVMTYNVHHCNPPDKKNVIDVDGTAAVIKAQQAAIVAVQEVDVNTDRSGKIDQAALLAKKAGFDFYYFAKAMDYDGGQYGILILSKNPLSDTKTIMLPISENKKDEPRVLALGTVTLPGGSQIRFGCTHLEAYNKTSRMMQIKEINRVANETNIPLIVAGDFNANENSEVIKTLDLTFVRTCTNCPNTFGETNVNGSIDFIAFKKGNPIEVKSHRVVPDKTTSDHMPVVAELRIIK